MGFAMVVTDYSVMYIPAELFILPQYQYKGIVKEYLGKLKNIAED